MPVRPCTTCIFLKTIFLVQTSKLVLHEIQDARARSDDPGNHALCTAPRPRQPQAFKPGKLQLLMKISF